MNFRPISLLLIVVGAFLVVKSLFDIGGSNYARRQAASGVIDMHEQTFRPQYDTDNAPTFLKIGGAVLILGIVLRVLSRRPRY